MFVAVVITLLSGCKKEPPKTFSDKILELTNIFIEGSIKSISSKLELFPEESRIPGELAISNWKNETTDPEPILIYAKLAKPVGQGSIRLCMYFSDEDADVLGVGIREESVKSNNGRGVVEELYPIYAPLSPFAIFTGTVPIAIRIFDERKDEQLWEEYANLNISTNDSSLTIADILPPLWISLPVPEKIEIWVWLYDRAGHESNKFKLHYYDMNTKDHKG